MCFKRLLSWGAVPTKVAHTACMLEDVRRGEGVPLPVPLGSYLVFFFPDRGGWTVGLFPSETLLEHVTKDVLPGVQWERAARCPQRR